MNSVDFPHSNAQLVAPQGWDEQFAPQLGPCRPLPVRRDGALITSMWKPSFRQLVKLAFGWRVSVTCIGLQPPMDVDICSPDHFKLAVEQGKVRNK